MLGKLLPLRKGNRPERPSFKPCLESLESREVPTCAVTDAAFHALGNNFNSLQANLTNRNSSGIDTDINALIGNIFQLQAGAPGFRVPDRLTIDTALITTGLALVFDGFQNFPNITIPQFENLLQLGSTSARIGFSDLLFTGFFPQTSGNCILT